MQTKKVKTTHVKKQDNIADVINKYPYTAEVFLSYGLHCVGCFASAFDTIEQGCQIHGMLDEDLKMLLNDVNTVINSYEEQTKKNR